ncbi:MAG: YdcF family protein [Ramlibacter sp.]|jgi:uncharacterized SAM-binding protein YcdF (DUF218 family)|uniref:YdcF family protein n=1 Tax=Ramlibacter sp. TaxID=1917967 RepID=UPI00261AEEA2|nr:YdcF family protein [Ramlibacter sp.]MDH4377270.1 YdcF family protein [Ramlibacter sp.]
MELGFIKPVLTVLVLPPSGPVLLALALLLLARRSRAARWIAGLALASLWLVSTPTGSIWLARTLLPLPPAIDLPALRQAGVQAVVVLGGGVMPEAPEYGSPQPSGATLGRLRYGVRLARAAQLPLGIAGGTGWAGRGQVTEAQVAATVARDELGLAPRWTDDRSRDTAENAAAMAALLARDGVRRIALVSDSWHLPRAAMEFRAAGLEVLPAPTRLPLPAVAPWMGALPSPSGLERSHYVLREWLALRVAALRRWVGAQG